MGSRGNTSSTNSAALSTIRRAPQLGQKPRKPYGKKIRLALLPTGEMGAFGEGEGFDQIIVGTQFQPFNTVVHAVSQ